MLCKHCQLMSGYTNFAVAGAGTIGIFIVQQLLKDKAAGTVREVIVITRRASKMIEGDAKVVQVDYSDEGSIKHALTGVHVVISTVSIMALDVQMKIAAAAKEADVKLFVPSQFGGTSTDGLYAAKVSARSQLKALGMPYAAFYTGTFMDMAWIPFIHLDVTSGKVSVGGDGNTKITSTSRPDAARYVTYVLTHLPPDQLKNRVFAIGSDNKSFNEMFKAYEERSGKKLEITYIPVSKLYARLAANPTDLVASLHKNWATAGPFEPADNYLYPDWNPSSAIDTLPTE